MTEQAKAAATGEGSVGGSGSDGDGYDSGLGRESQDWDVRRKKKRRVK